jgi:hypothetical protein
VDSCVLHCLWKARSAVFVIAGLAWIALGACVVVLAFKKRWRKAGLSAVGCTLALIIMSALAPKSDAPPVTPAPSANAVPPSSSMAAGSLPVVFPELLSTARPAASATPHHNASPSQLREMREEWDTANSAILTSGDSIHGQIASLLETPNEARDYPILADAPDAASAAQELPNGWQTTKALLVTVGDNITNARQDFKRWMDGADLDDDLKETLKTDSENIVDSMCSTLSAARANYRAAGGYANDLTFVLISEKGDRPCQNVPMSHPYSTTMKRRALVTIAESTNENPDANNEDAFLGDNTGFIVPAGTTVQVFGHRYVNSIEFAMCQIHGGGGTGWVPCSWLARTPQAKDG